MLSAHNASHIKLEPKLSACHIAKSAYHERKATRFDARPPKQATPRYYARETQPTQLYVIEAATASWPTLRLVTRDAPLCRIATGPLAKQRLPLRIPNSRFYRDGTNRVSPCVSSARCGPLASLFAQDALKNVPFFPKRTNSIHDKSHNPARVERSESKN